METITFNCRTITPLFSRSMKPAIGNRYQFELRPQSIKGVMRFWFRATAPFVINIYKDKNKSKDNEEKYKGLKKLEEMIFGSQNEKSPYRISVSWDIKKEKDVKVLKNGTNYDLKYAIFGMYALGKNGKNFTYLDSDSDFKIEMKISKRAPKYLKEYLISLVNLVSYYGGFGAKSRNGFGSFDILGENKINSKILGKNISNLYKIAYENKDLLFDIHKNIEKLEPYDYPSLLHSKSYVVNKNFNTWKEYINFFFKARTISNYGGIIPKTKITNLRKIYSNKDFISELRNFFFLEEKFPTNLKIDTSILGLPIKYRISKSENEPKIIESFDLNNIVENGTGRKASPLFFSIHKNEKLFARILIMSSEISEKRPNGKPILRVMKVTKGQEVIFGEVIGNEDFENLDNLIREGIKNG